MTIGKAFQLTPRQLFLPEDVTMSTDLDIPIPIGYGQTNSQPSTVYKMLDWLSVVPGNKILDVGCGSGWTTALLSRLTGPKGKVYGVERIPELVTFGKANCNRLRLPNINITLAGTALGYPAQAPYDRILVSAAADTLPQQLVRQLKRGGIMVIPVDGSIFVITKNNSLEIVEHPGYAFVPLLNGK